MALVVVFVTLLPTSLSECVRSKSVSQGLDGRTPIYDYEVMRIYPHDRGAFTQGLVYLDGLLYESTGLHGSSTLRKVQLETGEVLQEESLDPRYFAEGLTDWGTDLVQITWRSNVGFIYDRSTLEMKTSFDYPGEGWGLTHDGTSLIMSDGTATLRFLDPETLQETRRLTVSDGIRPVVELNELEYVRGEIYANVWRTDRIARISPQTGRVTGWIELGGLLNDEDREIAVDILNGIAYDPQEDRLFVTGKLWPKLFEIRLVPRR